MASSVLQAKVKGVLSGDTLILVNPQSTTGQEKVLSLAYVSAPRLKREGDEPFAFESREFIRKLVGTTVNFRVLYTIPSSNREYGVLEFSNGARLPDNSVAEGWVKLRDDAGRKDDSEEATSMLEKLKALEARARADSKGIWSDEPNAGRIEVDYELSDSKAFVEEHKGKPINGVVEKVLTGDRLIVRLQLSPTKHLQTIVLVGGIRAPSTKRVNPSDGKEQPAEPYGDEAHRFVDAKLHQRPVLVEVLGTSPQGQLVATVKHPKAGDIAPAILKAGLARCADHHSTLLGTRMSELRRAEKEAKDTRKGLYTGHVAQKAVTPGGIEAQVARVFSADTLFLRNKEGREKRVNLSSVRQPKPSDPAQAPWVPEAKEFLRKRLIGKTVNVVIDGKRPATDGFEEREMATVTFHNENVGMLLVKNGYASVIRHRRDDPDRSPIYDDLLLAESEAQAEGKGMWAKKGPGAKKEYVDYSESLEKAKRQLTVWQRQKKVPAIVDFVKSGSRFSLLIPRDNAKITLVLSGIRAPKSARNESDTADPFGNEAHQFVNRRCLQRDVEIDIEDTDKNGAFIGALYINRENMAKILVEEGLAEVHQYSAEKSGHATELNAAESKAKAARKNLWQNWDPSKEVDDAAPEATNGTNGETASVERRKDYRDIMVTDVGPDGRLKIQQIGNGTAALTELMNKFRTFHLNPANKTSLPGPPKAGDFVAAKFTADQAWYRAKIRRNDREAQKAEVVYIDYGNSETVPWADLRPLTQPEFSTQKLKPQAAEAVLSFVQFPSNPMYLQEAVDHLADCTADKQLVANVDHIAPEGTLHVTLFDPKRSQTFEDSVNADIIGEGFAMVPRKLKAWERGAAEVWASLKSKQQDAKDGHRGMWEYGEIDDDEE